MYKRVLMVLVVFGLLLSACSTGAAPSNAPANGSTQPAAETPPSNSTGSEVQISISGFAFDPQSITITKGSTVVWTNKDSVPHNIVEANNLFKSPSLANGDEFRFTFDTAGTFEYICSIHPTMKGEIIVN